MLRTKFHAPRLRAGQVPRSRLLARLIEGVEAPLTVISAPPAFGKTTLLAEWLAAPELAGRRIAWLSLDSSDDHPPTFWRYVFTALAEVVPAIGKGGLPEAVTGAQPVAIETLLTLLINIFEAEDSPVMMLLDDYHVIESPAIREGIAFLVEHLPRQLQVVLSGRADPDLPLHRLRARGLVNEVRTADLRFVTEEAEAFLNGAMGLSLGHEAVGRLTERTEGWAGALQLAAISLKGRPEPNEFIAEFSGGDRQIVDYLVEEVLERQTAEVRDFLLRTSILGRLSASLCEAVTGKTGARSTLDLLERTNLFLVPLDEQRRWYRYHHLFAEVLQAHLAEELPGEPARLHLRASEWYEGSGEPDFAIRHALFAGDHARAAGLIELQAEAVMQQHNPEKLISWLKPIPPGITASMPVLSTYFGHALQGIGDLEGSAARLDDAERAVAGKETALPVFDHRSFEALAARIAVGRGFLSIAAGDADATVQHATRALALIAPDEHHWRGTAVALLGLAHWIRGELEPAEALHAEAVSHFERSGQTGLAITSSFHHAELLKARGRLNAAGRRLEQSLRFVARHPDGAIRGAANLHIGLSELACERNDLAAAEAHLAKAGAVGVYPPRTPFRRCLAVAHLSQSRGDWHAALEALEEAAPLQVRGAVPVYRPVGAWRARLLARGGEFEDAWRWARGETVSPDDPASYLREYDHITLARLLLARAAPGDLETADSLLERLLLAALEGGRDGTAVEIRVLLAVARERQGKRETAMAAIKDALIAAEPEGYVRVFLDEGDAIVGLLQAATAAAPAYCRRLLAALGVEKTSSPAAIGPEALSERELEVLRLLASDLSGPEIASTLVVSLNTLRSHTKNIFGKLAVNSRRAAVRRAGELRLL